MIKIKTMREKTQKVTVTMTKPHKEKLKEFSKDIFGKENISGMIGFLTEKWDKQKQTFKK